MLQIKHKPNIRQGMHYDISDYLLTCHTEGGLAALSPAVTTSGQGLPVRVAPEPETSLRISVRREDRAAIVELLLRSGGARALPDNRFDVAFEQINSLAEKGLYYRVEGWGEPLRDSATPELQ